MLKRILTLTTIMVLSFTTYAQCREEAPQQDDLHLFANCSCEKEENSLLAHESEDHDQAEQLIGHCGCEQCDCEASEKNDDLFAKCPCEKDDSLLAHESEDHEQAEQLISHCSCEQCDCEASEIDEENALCNADESKDASLANCGCGKKNKDQELIS